MSKPALMFVALVGLGASVCTRGNGRQVPAPSGPSGGSGDPTDGGTDVSGDPTDGGTDVSGDPTDGGTDVSGDPSLPLECQRRLPQNGSDAFVTPPLEEPEQPRNWYVSRLVSVEKREVPDGFVERTWIDFTGTTEIPTTLSFGVAVQDGWDVATQPGDTIRFERWKRYSTCFERDSQGSIENMLFAAGSIRSEAGELLLLAASTMPLARDGTVVLGGEFTPEVELRWVDAGCPDFPDAVLLPYEQGTGARIVAIEARDPSEPTVSIAMLPGEPGREIALAGQTYVLAVARAEVARDTEWCGHSAFVLYKQGYLMPPSDGAEADEK